MATPSQAFEIIKAFFHALGKTNTEATQNVFESLYKSAHNISPEDVRIQDVGYAVDVTAADLWVANNPTIGKKYTKVALTAVPGSNNQAWYLSDAGTFIRGWISPVDVPEPTTAAPSYGYQANLYDSSGTLIPPTSGVWVIDYFSGIVMFQAGYDPITMGWGAPKITCYVYIGQTLSGDRKSVV